MKRPSQNPRAAWYRYSFRNLSKAALVAAVTVFCAQNSPAASPSIWNGGGTDDNWTTAANWGGNVPVPGTNYDLQFGGTTRLTPNNNFTAGSNFRNLTFNAGAGAFTLGGNGITLNGDVTNNSLVLQTIIMNLALAAGAHSFSLQSGGGDLAIGSSSDSSLGVISGAGTITLAGVGTLTLWGNNSSYSGATTVTQSVATSIKQIGIGNNNALGSGTLALANGSTVFAAGGARAINNVVTYGGSGGINGASVTIGGSNDLTFNGTVNNIGTTARVIVASNTGTTTFAGSLNLADGTTANRSVVLAVTGGTVAISGVLADFGGAANNTGAVSPQIAAGTFLKSGLGTLTLSGSNVYTSNTSLNGGTVNLDYSTNNNTKLASAATLSLGGVTLNLSGGSFAQTVASTSLNAGESTINRSSGTSTLALGSLTRNAGSALNVGTGGIFTTTTGSASTLLNTTAGVVGVVGGNDWAAKDAANSTIVGLSTVASYTNSTASTLSGNADVVTDVSGTTLAATTLRFNGAAARTITATTLTLGATASGGGILVTSAVGNNLTTITGGTLRPGANNTLHIFQNNLSNGLTIASLVANNGSNAATFIKNGVGLVTLSNAANTYTGLTYLNGGTTNIVADGSLGTAPAAATAGQLNMNGGTLQFGAANISLVANRGVAIAVDGATFDTNGNAATVNGIIANNGATNATASNGFFAPLIKTGAGTLTLTGANTYTGATNVNAGTLLVNSTHTGLTSYTVGNAATPGTTATLGGSGTISAPVIVAGNGALSPGAAGAGSIGMLSVGALTLANTSSLVFDLNTTTPGTGSDLIAVNGALVLDGQLTINSSGALAAGQQYQLFTYTSGALTDNGLTVGALPSGFAGTIDTATPGIVYLDITTAVPEPSTWVSGIMLAGLLGYRYRRQIVRRSGLKA